MIEKNIDFHDDAKSSLINGINKVADAVSSTLGAAGTTVILEDQTGRPHITKDGVTVAKTINLSEPVEHLAAEIIKQASIKTADEAGDGTTTSIVLARSIISNAFKKIKENPKINVTILREEIDYISEKVCKYLDKKAKPVDQYSVENVATISANNDPTLGKIISQAYNKVGVDGVVTIEESMRPDHKTYVEIVEGTRIKRGFQSPYLITDKEKNTVVLDNPFVLISDKKIDTLDDISIPCKAAMNTKRSLLIISEIEQTVMNVLNVNKAKGIIKVNVLPPEGVGLNRFELLEDLASMTGAIVVSDQTGNDWNGVTAEFLGEAKKSVSTNKETILTLNLKKTADAVNEKIERIKAIIKNKEDISNDWHYKDRLSRLSGGIAAIFVGAHTEIEMKEKKDRVDDSICATRAALEEGILPGGGAALFHASSTIYWGIEEKEERRAACEILWRSLREPLKTIVNNSGMPVSEIEEKVGASGRHSYGYDVKNKRIGDMFRYGIIDPLKVTKMALKNAISVSNTILQTNCVISNKRA